MEIRRQARQASPCGPGARSARTWAIVVPPTLTGFLAVSRGTGPRMSATSAIYNTPALAEPTAESIPLVLITWTDHFAAKADIEPNANYLAPYRYHFACVVHRTGCWGYGQRYVVQSLYRESGIVHGDIGGSIGESPVVC
jgi:hypothetical protein